MVKIAYKHIIFCLLLVALFGCNKNKSVAFPDPSSTDYLKRFSQALISDNKDFVLSTIIYMDNLIEKEGDKSIRSIHYNKAQLLYKIKQYDRALEALYRADDSAYDVPKASLLILLGHQNEALYLLEKSIEASKKVLIEDSLSEYQKTFVIQGLVALYVLADMYPESLAEELVVEKIITGEDAYIILQQNTITKEVLLNSMWLGEAP
jgi:tetratricopeptide (TPR) repeat protein